MTLVTVPSQYQAYVNEAASGTGLPESVTAAQAQAESNFNVNAVSSTGAEGFWQFEPGTYNEYAGAAGVPVNSEFNIADETKVYEVYMNTLLKQEGGNVFQALEAYNAGPGNLPAGASYASGILQNAGVSQASTDAATFNLPLPSLSNPLGSLNIGSDIQNAISNAFGSSIENQILKSLGVPDLKDLFQRLGLILLGAALIIVGISLMGKINVEGITLGSGQPKVKETTSESNSPDGGDAIALRY